MYSASIEQKIYQLHPIPLHQRLSRSRTAGIIFGTSDWYQFEKLVALLFEQEGFVVHRSGGARADGGIDLTATKDGVIFGVQCKHWKSWRVGVEHVRAFLGALHDNKLRNGFMVTLEGYTKDAACAPTGAVF
jgi:restriction system protein